MAKAKTKSKGTTTTAQKAPAKRAKKAASGSATKPIDLAPVRQKVTQLVAKAAPEMVKAVIGEVKNRGSVPALKYLFESTAMFPAPDGQVEQAEESMAGLLIKRLEVGMIPAESEDEDPEAAGGNAVE